MPLPNPGFESGSSGWVFGGTGSSGVVTNSAQAHSGQNFAQLVSPVAGNHPLVSGIVAGGTSIYWPVNPGDVITFGGWAARLGGDGTVHWVLQVSDANKLNPVYSITSNVTSSAWTYYQNTYTIPSTGHYVRLYCEIYGNTIAATANFDDAVFVYTPKSTMFNYQGSPIINWLGPDSGPANSANPVHIAGSNFAAGTTVTFGGIAATNVSVLSGATITANTPKSAAGAVKVVVTSATGLASSPVTYTFNPPPSLSSISPSSGPLTGGASVAISGTNFLPGAKLTFGGAPAINVSTSADSITATTPPGAAGLVSVVVTNPDGQSATVTGGYSYLQPPPTLSALVPASGTVKGGTAVVLSGTNFLPNPSVTFGGTAAAVSSATATTITVTTPADSTKGAVDVAVTNSDGQVGTLSGGFDYVAAGPTPAVSSISSNSGSTAGGANVTISGSNFVSGATVTFGGASASNVTFVSSSSITATTPPHAAGPVNVTVTNPDGQSATLLGVISLLPNASFESGPVDWTLVGNGSATVLNDPANAEAGNNYALLTSNPGGPATYYATDSSGSNQYFPVTAGDVITYGGGAYRLSGDGLTNDTLVVTDASKNVLSTWRTTPSNADTPTWTNMQGTYTIPAGAAYIRLGLQIRSNTVTAQVRFDEVTLERMPAGGGYTYLGPSSPGVFTYHYDNARSGVNPNETTLTPVNVTSATFGKKFTYPVDGWIDAQPLYVASVTINGTAHNVVYVATEHDSVYAFDADGLQTTPLWQTSFINVADEVTTIPTSDLVLSGIPQPEFGIMATPVIDPVAGTIYVLARTLEDGKYVQRLHALDITSGAERTNSPALVQASIPGTGTGSVNGLVPYSGYSQNVRPALSLVNGTVYFGAASLEDLYDYHGWVFAYDAQSLNRVGVFCVTPNGSRGGVWLAGGGMAADSAGNLYVQTGNGTFDANLGGQDYGDSIVKLQLGSAGLNPVDYFTPWDQTLLSQQDLDISSGAALLLPDQPGLYPHELIGGGKEGTLYVLNRDAMGGFNSAGDTQIIQELPAALTPTTETVDAGLWNTPMYFNNTVYFVGRNDVMKAFAMRNGTLAGPMFKGNTTLFVTDTAISANGTSNAILWVAQGDINVIHAYNPYDLTKEYYDTNQAGTRDVPATLTRFMAPLVVNGKMYVGTRSELDVYGLF